MSGGVESYAQTSYNFFVGDSASASTIQGVPLNLYYEYSVNQMLYTAEDVEGVAGQINSFSFYQKSNYSSTRKVKIYVGMTEQESFEASSNTDEESQGEIGEGGSSGWGSSGYGSSSVKPVNASSSLVYDGEISLVSGWNTVTFTSSFNYDGQKNIVITIVDTTNSYSYNVSYAAVETSKPSTVRYQDYSAKASFEEFVAKTSGISSFNKKPVMKFNITPSGGYCPSVTNIASQANGKNGVIISWNGSANSYDLEYRKAGTTDWTIISNITATTYNVIGLVSYSKYEVRVKANCSESSSSYKTFAFTTDLQEGDYDIMVGDSETAETDSYVPIRTYNKANISQIIYHKEKMEGIKGNINSIAFWANASYKRQWKVYAVEYDKEQYSSDDAVVDAESQLLFDDTLTITTNGWTTVNFTTSFHYTGEKDLIITIVDTAFANNGTTYFKTFSTDPNHNYDHYFVWTYSVWDASIAYKSLDSVIAHINDSEVSSNIRTLSDFPVTKFNVTSDGEYCTMVKGFKVADTTDGNRLTLSWSPSEAASYTVEYKRDYETEWQSVNTIDTFVTVDNLNAQTKYNLRVKGNCTTVSSAWNEISFTTFCGVALTPYAEGFENLQHSYYGYETPDCWTIYDGGAEIYDANYTYWTAQSNGSDFTELGTNHMTVRHSIDDETVYNDWLVSPKIRLTGSEHLTFFARTSTAKLNGWGEYDPSINMGIYVGQSLDDIDSATIVDGGVLNGFTLVNHVTIDSLTDYTRFDVDLSSYTGDYYIAFRPESGTWCYLDSVRVAEPPACESPSLNSLVLSNATYNSFDVTFDDPVSSHNAWIIYYKQKGATEWQTKEINAKSVTLDGLTPTATYDVQVAAKCSATEISEKTWMKTIELPQEPVDLPFYATFTDGEWVRPAYEKGQSHVGIGVPQVVYYGDGSVFPGLDQYTENSFYLTTDDSVANNTFASYNEVLASKTFNLGTFDSIRLSFDVFQLAGGFGFYYLPADVDFNTLNSSEKYDYAYVFKEKPTSWDWYKEKVYYISSEEGEASKHWDITLPNINPGGAARIIFRMKGTSSSPQYKSVIVNNLSIKEVKCLERVNKSSISHTNIKWHTTKLTWDSIEGVNNYVIRYKQYNDTILDVWSDINQYHLYTYYKDQLTPWTYVTCGGENLHEYTLTGLEAFTMYEVEIAPLCNGDTGSYSHYGFTTRCKSIENIPYVEHFTSKYANNCWNVVTGVSNDYYSNDGQYLYTINRPGWDSAYQAIRMEPNGYANESRSMIATPPIQQDIQTLKIKYTLSRGDFAETFSNLGQYTRSFLEVGVISDVADSTTFEPVDTIKYITWSKKDGRSYETYFDKTKLSGEGLSIAFRWTPGADNYNQFDSDPLFIDSLRVEYIPDCRPPLRRSVYVSEPRLNSITVHFNDPDVNHNKWKVYYTKEYANDWKDTVVTSQDFVLGGLDSLTGYWIKVATICSDGSESETTASCNFHTWQSPASLPYTTDWDNADDWIIKNEYAVNRWHIDDGALKVSERTNGDTYSSYYSDKHPSTVLLQKAFIMDDSDSLEIKFDAKLSGYDGLVGDYVSIYLMPHDTIIDAMPSVVTKLSPAMVWEESWIGGVTFPYDGPFGYYKQYAAYTGGDYSTLKLNQHREYNDTVNHYRLLIPNPAPYDTVNLMIVWTNGENGGFSSTSTLAPEIYNFNINNVRTYRPDYISVTSTSTNSMSGAFWVHTHIHADKYLLRYKALSEDTVYHMPENIGESMDELSFYYSMDATDDSWTTMVIDPEENSSSRAGGAFTIEGLQPNTNYQIEIAAMGQGYNEQGVHDTSMFAGVITRTQCDPISAEQLPWIENFENGNASLSCWTRMKTTAHGSQPYVTTSHEYVDEKSGESHHVVGCDYEGTEGENALILSSLSSTGYQWVRLATPAFDEDIHKLRMSFRAAPVYPNSSRLRVSICKNPAWGQESENVYVKSLGATNEFQDFEIDFGNTNSTGKGYHIVFACENSNTIDDGQMSILIDSVVVWGVDCENDTVYKYDTIAISYNDLPQGDWDEKGGTFIPYSQEKLDSLMQEQLASVDTRYDYVRKEGGCDSVYITKTSYIQNESQKFVNLYDTICSNSTYTFAGVELTEGGVYYDTVAVSDKLDSITVLNLAVNPAYNDTIDNTHHEGLYLISKNGFSSAEDVLSNNSDYEGYYNGIKTDSLLSVNGCDSVVTYVIDTVKLAEDICANSTYMFAGQEITEAGEYYGNVVTENRGIWFVKLRVEVLPAYDTTIYDTVKMPVVSDPVVDTFQAINGCDSIIRHIMVYVPGKYSQAEITLCDGETYEIADTVIATSGEYMIETVAADGADSTIYLTVYAGVSTNDTVLRFLCPDDTLEIDGRTFTATGFYTDTLQSIAGCDSIVTYDIEPGKLFGKVIEKTICAGETYKRGGKEYTESGTYYIPLPSNYGCDDNDTLILTVAPKYDTTIYETMCWQEGMIDNSGDYVDSLQTADGCDSIIYHAVTVLQPGINYLNVPLCEGKKYVVGDTSVTSAGQYTFILPNMAANGCDSIIYANVTMVTSSDTVINESVCQGATFTYMDWTFTATTSIDTIIQIPETEYTCEGTAEIHLTVNPVYHVYDTVNLYEYEGAYTFEGQIIDQNGDYKSEYLTVNGCDSVLYLHAYTKNVNDTVILTDDGKFIIDGDEVKLDSCSGSGDVVIPATVTDEDGNEYPVTSIGEGAFKDNDSITSVTIPATVTEIGCEAFLDCDNLDTIIMLPEVPPTICDNTLPPADSKDGAPVIKVPCGAGAAYKAAPVWKNYQIVEDCDGLNDAEDNTAIRIYPNPAKESVTVECKGNITVINSLGQIVKVINGNEQTHVIDLNNWESGVYYIKITNDNKLIKTEKLIVK